MSNGSAFATTNNYNPDVLTCLANLSNDEIFTPPSLANKILDLLPEEIWHDKTATFLDPATKSGVFLREITARLIKGLEHEIPDLQERINHICKNQVFGVAITELTGLLSRRSLYCSKLANGEYSICTCFEYESGNVKQERVKHTWKDGKCIFCGASEGTYDRDEMLENYAYQFIHTKTPEEIFNMKFDVIVGNPPYQLGSNDNRASSRDMPIYNLFVEQAMKLNPRYLTMIIPSRWMAAGLGLKNFRNSMLSDKRIRKLVDYPSSSDVFSGVEIKGGVCYFLWDRDSKGPCTVITIRDNQQIGPYTRDLNEFDIFVRDSRSLSILRKVLAHNEISITEILSVDKEFGWTSNFNDFHNSEEPDDVPIYYNRKGKRLIGWISRDEITKSQHLIDKWKVMTPQAGSDGGARIPDVVLGNCLIAPSPSVCTQTYLFFYVNSEIEAENLASYLRTHFFRFLVSLRKITQHATRSTYTWVPIQDFSKPWTDAELYQKYELSNEEINFIELMIKPMET